MQLFAAWGKCGCEFNAMEGETDEEGVAYCITSPGNITPHALCCPCCKGAANIMEYKTEDSV